MNEFNITQQEIEDGKGLAGVAYLTWIGLLIAFLVGKENRFTMYHVQQALGLMILMFAAGILAAIPILGWIVFIVVWIFGIVCFIIGLINGFGGKVKPLPLIGEIAYKFNIVKLTQQQTQTPPSQETPPPPPPPSDNQSQG